MLTVIRLFDYILSFKGFIKKATAYIVKANSILAFIPLSMIDGKQNYVLWFLPPVHHGEMRYFHLQTV